MGNLGEILKKVWEIWGKPFGNLGGNLGKFIGTIGEISGKSWELCGKSGGNHGKIMTKFGGDPE